MSQVDWICRAGRERHRKALKEIEELQNAANKKSQEETKQKHMEKRKLRKTPAWARGCDSLFRLHYRRDLFTSSSQDASAVSANPCPSLAYSASYLTCSFTCWRRSNCSTPRGLTAYETIGRDQFC